jgi:hypothetical protein
MKLPFIGLISALTATLGGFVRFGPAVVRWYDRVRLRESRARRIDSDVDTAWRNAALTRIQTYLLLADKAATQETAAACRKAARIELDELRSRNHSYLAAILAAGELKAGTRVSLTELPRQRVNAESPSSPPQILDAKSVSGKLRSSKLLQQQSENSEQPVLVRVPASRSRSRRQQ